MDRVAVSVPHGATWGTGRGFSMRTAGRRPGLSIQNVLWGWNVLSRLSPSKAEATCCNCNATKGHGPGRVNARAWAARQQVACRDPGAVRTARCPPGDRSTPHGPRVRTFTCHSRVRGRARATPAARTQDTAGTVPRAGWVHRTCTKPSPGNDRNGSIGAAVSCHVVLAHSLCTVRVRGSLPLLDAVSWYQVTVSGLAAGPADVRPRRAPGDRQRT